MYRRHRLEIEHSERSGMPQAFPSFPVVQCADGRPAHAARAQHVESEHELLMTRPAPAAVAASVDEHGPRSAAAVLFLRSPRQWPERRSELQSLIELPRLQHELIVQRLVSEDLGL